MKLVVDENVTFAEEVFGIFGEVIKYPGREIKNYHIKDADALIVRSVTEVNKALLEKTNVKFVGTATIGSDHIDTNFLKENNIYFTTAAGCNSYAVAEYVMSGLSYLINKYDFNMKNKSIGIIGVGNIGCIIEKYATSLGLNVVLNDPPLQRKTGDKKYKSLEEVLNCDIITLHTPLIKSGIDKTVHLINENNISLINPGSILINSCRGPVVDNNALKSRLKKKNDIFAIFDVWENEPELDTELLKLVEIGTPHIAGYSYEGKVNGTLIIAEKLAEFLNKNFVPSVKVEEVNNPELKISSLESNDFIKEIFEQIYEIEKDSSSLKSFKNQKNLVLYFDGLRKNYLLRRELINYYIKKAELKTDEKNILKTFRLKNK